ncbi:MAG TPA: hypothetical protein VI488_15485 [Candidatus Angelobacter sp.]
MNRYIANRTCQCPRCRANGLMGAAVLITLGVLFLLAEFWVIPFHQSVPVLLIVIGLMLYLGRSASTEGHIQPPNAAGMLPPPPPIPRDQHGPEVNQ